MIARACVGFACVLSFASAASAIPIIIQGTEDVPYTPITNQLALSHGATFSSTNPYVTFGEMIPGVWGIFGTDPTGNPLAGNLWFFSPIIVTFVDMSDGVTPAVVNGTISAVWGDAGGDLDGVDIRAYDLGNNLLQVASFTGISFTPISITNSGIHRVEFWPNTSLGSPTSDTFLDSLSYPTPTPGPTAASLLGLAAVFAYRRRAPAE